MFATCPRLQKMMSDPARLHRIVNAAQWGHTSRGGSTANSTTSATSLPNSAQAPGRAPPTSNRSATTRQSHDDNTNDNVASAIFTDEKGSDGENLDKVHERPSFTHPDHLPGGAMSTGMVADNSSNVPVTSCSCCEPLPLFSLIDLDAFQHKTQVEEWIKNFSEPPSLPDLAEAEIRTHCAPEILATILSPDAMGWALDCQGHQTHPDFRHGCATLDFTNCGSQTDPVHFMLKLMRGPLFTECVIAPTKAEHVSLHPPDSAWSPSTTRLPCSGSCPSTKDVNNFGNEAMCVLHLI